MNNKFARSFKLFFFLGVILIMSTAAVILPERKLSGVATYPDFLTAIVATSDATENLTDVPLYSQPTAETCGETAFVMAWNYIHPDKALDIREVISFATQEGWYVPSDPAGVYTSPSHMYDMGNYYAGQHGSPSPEVGHMTDSQQALTFLFSQMMLGRPVIVDVTTIIDDIDSAAHFVVVTGVSLTDATIEYNDPYGYIAPDKHQANQERVKWSTFWNSWRNNGDNNGEGNGWYMIVK